MQISVKELRKIVMEAVEKELKEQASDDGGSGGDSEGGMDESLSGSGWHGESQYLSEPSRDRGFSAETSDERRRRMERDQKSSKEFSDSYNQSSRYDESRKPKGLNLEALRKLVRETIEEDWGSSYSSGGAGGNRHGDSWDEAEPERGYRPKSEKERQEELERMYKSSEEASRSYDQSSRYDESRKHKGLTLEALRKMVRAAIRENVFEQAPPPPPAPPAPAATPAAPVPVAPAAPVAAAPAAPADPNAAQPAAPAAAPAPVSEAVHRIVREAVRKHLQEKKEGKWMQKAGEEMEAKGTKGALHRALGKKEGEKLSKSELESKKAALQKKGEGDKKLSAEDRKLLRRIIFALNAMKAKKD